MNKREKKVSSIKGIDRSCRKLRARHYFPRATLLEILCVLLKVTRRGVISQATTKYYRDCRRATIEKFPFDEKFRYFNPRRSKTSYLVISLWAIVRLQLYGENEGFEFTYFHRIFPTKINGAEIKIAGEKKPSSGEIEKPFASPLTGSARLWHIRGAARRILILLRHIEFECAPVFYWVESSLERARVEKRKTKTKEKKKKKKKLLSRPRRARILRK